MYKVITGTCSEEPQLKATIPAKSFVESALTGSLGTGRYFHTMTLLKNGKVLETGG